MGNKVTPEMREAWFYSNGWYADDATILRWYLRGNNKGESK